MNLIRKLFGGASTTPPSAERVGVILVDEEHFQPVLRRLARSAGTDGTLTVTVVEQRNNARNPGAICAQLPSGEILGYLSATDARRFRPAIERLERRGVTLRCPARIVTGADADPTLLRVELALGRPEDLR